MNCTLPVLQQRKAVTNEHIFLFFFVSSCLVLNALLGGSQQNDEGFTPDCFGGTHFPLFLTFLEMYTVRRSAFLFTLMFKTQE